MCWTTSGCNIVPLDGLAFSCINIHFCSQTYHSTECMCNYFVNYAVVELGSAMHSEHKINFISHYLIHNLQIFLKGCESVTLVIDKAIEKCDKLTSMIVRA
jgi:hypothetical protein